MISIQIDSTTGSEVVSTAELKSYARIETSDDDTIIANMIIAAREKCEAIINRDIVAKTRSLFISNLIFSFKLSELRLNRKTKIFFTRIISYLLLLSYTPHSRERKSFSRNFKNHKRRARKATRFWERLANL